MWGKEDANSNTPILFGKLFNNNMQYMRQAGLTSLVNQDNLCHFKFVSCQREKFNYLKTSLRQI